MCLHLWVICRVHVIDPVCAVAGRNGLMKRMTSCFYFWSYFSKFHMVWCQNVLSKSAFGGFTQTDFSIKSSGRERPGTAVTGKLKPVRNPPHDCGGAASSVAPWFHYEEDFRISPPYLHTAPFRNTSVCYYPLTISPPTRAHISITLPLHVVKHQIQQCPVRWRGTVDWITQAKMLNNNKPTMSDWCQSVFVPEKQFRPFKSSWFYLSVCQIIK